MAGASAAAPRSAAHLPPGTRARHAQHLAGLAESYLQMADAPGAAASPDVASATFYASHALALEPDSVQGRRVLATCYMMGGAKLVFPFAPSSLGHASTPAPNVASRAGALAAVHLLQRGASATFADVQSARIYATACTALGRFREAQDALEWTMHHATQPPETAPERDRDGAYASQVSTQLGRIAMKQARYSDAAAYFAEARQHDLYNWGAYTGLCDIGMAPSGPEAFAEASTSTRKVDKPEPQPMKRARPDDRRDDAPSGPSTRPTRPVRRVTPRAAALRSGMARTNAVPPPPKDTKVPPVPSVPRRQASETARGTLGMSRNTNQATERPAPPPPKLERPLPARPAPKKPEAKPRMRPASAASRTDSGLRRSTDAPPRPEARPAVRAESESERYTLQLLRDVGEAYRLVRLYRGREALPLLDASAVPPGSLRACHRRIASMQCLLARALHDCSEYAQAETHFAQARGQEPFLLMHMDIYSLVLFQLHREVALSALAQDLLEIDPRATVAHIAAGNTWSLQHQHDAAYQCFVQATLVSPECAYAYTLAGYEALELDQPVRAVRLFRCARRCDKRHWNALAGLGQVYLREGNAALASEAYAEAFLINSSNPVLLDLLGYALEQAGNLDGALSVYQRAIRMNPKAAMTRLKKAQLLLKTVHEAQHDVRRGEVAALTGREIAQRRAAAHAELLKVCALAPMEPQVHLLLARSYMRLGGGRFTTNDAASDATPPSSPGGGVREARLPRQYASEIAHHLATAVDLDPRCVREVSAMGEGAKLALHAGGNASIAEDDHDESQYDGAFLDDGHSVLTDGESIDGDALMLDPAHPVLYDSSGSAEMQASHSFVYEQIES